ncbi:MAG: hypothetical protein AB7E04_08665 [Desulfobacteraceae bacterium]|jgi:transcriptional regulator with XRE-family HTH domain
MNIEYDAFFERLYEVIDDYPLSFWNEKLGSTAVIQSRWKKGQFPGSAKLIQLCKAANISPTWLFFGIGEKKIITDISDINDVYFKDFLEKSIYKLKDINLFLDIFLNLSLETFVSINKIPIKNIFTESENFITKLELLQKALGNAVISLKEEMSGELISDKSEKKFILSYDSKGYLNFVNDFFLDKFNLEKESILNTRYKLPISEKDRQRVEKLFEKMDSRKVNHIESRVRVIINNNEEWQHWSVTSFFEENGKYSRKSIGYSIPSDQIRNEQIMRA